MTKRNKQNRRRLDEHRRPGCAEQRKQYGDNERKADRENLKKLLARAENIADGDGVKFSDVVGSRFVVDSGFVKDSSDAAK